MGDLSLRLQPFIIYSQLELAFVNITLIYAQKQSLSQTC